MEQEKRGSTETNEQPVNGAAENENTISETKTGTASDLPREQLEGLESSLEALRAENTDLKDKSLRLMAEMENLRRRTERDKSEFSKYAISEFARDVVGVGDNIRRAIEAVPKEAAENDPALSGLIEGIEVTERELLKILDKYQVKRFDPKGERFNPHLHEAMTRIEVPNMPADTIVQVIHAGYMIGERVLRPAAVIVAKGGGGSDKQVKLPEDEPIPPGAMRVPEEVVSSRLSQHGEASGGVRSDGQKNVLGREFRTEKRRSPSHSERPDERVTEFRRPRSAAGDQSYSEVRQQNGHGSSKPSTLHKPVIGTTKE
jgi:molecular chaperone GrpE